MWDGELVFAAEWHKETKLSLEKYFLALESLFCLYLAVYCVIFFRNAIASRQKERCGLCYTNFGTV